jgi:hypothetical protein
LGCSVGNLNQGFDMSNAEDNKKNHLPYISKKKLIRDSVMLSMNEFLGQKRQGLNTFIDNSFTELKC